VTSLEDRKGPTECGLSDLWRMQIVLGVPSAMETRRFSCVEEPMGSAKLIRGFYVARVHEVVMAWHEAQPCLGNVRAKKSAGGLNPRHDN
jgi:hypothetical protein